MSGWQHVLDEFEQLLDEIDAHLSRGEWDEVEPPFVAPAPLDALPTPAQQARLGALLVRAEQHAEVLRGELDRTQGELDELGRRRRAASSYVRSDTQSLKPSSGAADG